MAKTPFVSFRASDLQGALERRTPDGSLGLTAKRDLERYYSVLSAELALVQFTEHEAALLCEALDGYAPEPDDARYAWYAVEEAIWTNAIRHRDPDVEQSVLAKLRGLRPAQAMAVLDAAERFYASGGRQALRDLYENGSGWVYVLLRKVRLVGD